MVDKRRDVKGEKNTPIETSDTHPRGITNSAKHLPVIQETHFLVNRALHKVNEKEKTEIPVVLAQAYLKQKYPLTAEGEKLRDKVREALSEKNIARLEQLAELLPTVENPHLDLFQDLNIKDEETHIFGENLANIQITKGCRHQCDFCAANANKKVQTMPYAAILKIAERKHRQEDHELTELMEIENNLDVKWEEWRNFVQGETGVDIDSPDLSSWDLFHAQEKLYDKVKAYPDKPDDNSFYPDYTRILTHYPFAYLHGNGWLEPCFKKKKIAEIINYKKNFIYSIHNYFDSDAFDYRDHTFLHKDGTPADYGDIVRLLATEKRPVHITTAGWPLNDKVAQRAAEKIVALHKENPKLLINPRISVAETNRMMGRKGNTAYLDAIKNVIGTLIEIDPEILTFYEKNMVEGYYFQKQVIDPLRLFHLQIYRGSPNDAKKRFKKPKISYFSGRHIENQQPEEKDHDVTACMPGYHIWPDGTVAEQKILFDRNNKLKRGTGSVPTGIKIYELEKSGN